MIRMKVYGYKIQSIVAVCAMCLAMIALCAQAGAQQDSAPPSQDQQQSSQDPSSQGNASQSQAPQNQPQSAQLSPEQLQQLVAPIALYPDALVAQILAGSAYPTQIVEADRFLQQNPDLKGDALGAEVDKQDWDPSVKALTQFPSVLADMDKNLSWTSELGDANYNQQADVMAAVQYMRGKAQAAGNLKTSPQQTVTSEGSNIEIQPANPQIVYVPTYNPSVIYGYPVGVWPGLYPWWGPGPYFSWGIGFGVGPFIGFGWGWNAWGFDWYHRGLLYGGGAYGYHSHAFYNRNAYFHGNYHGQSQFVHGDRSMRGYQSSATGARPASPGTRPGTRSAFGTVSHGGDSRTSSARGQASYGGSHGGGGGGHPSGGGGGGHPGGGSHH
jgi:uncharacterized membrane protein YgcG